MRSRALCTGSDAEGRPGHRSAAVSMRSGNAGWPVCLHRLHRAGGLQGERRWPVSARSPRPAMRAQPSAREPSFEAVLASELVHRLGRVDGIKWSAPISGQTASAFPVPNGFPFGRRGGNQLAERGQQSGLIFRRHLFGHGDHGIYAYGHRSLLLSRAWGDCSGFSPGRPTSIWLGH